MILLFQGLVKGTFPLPNAIGPTKNIISIMIIQIHHPFSPYNAFFATIPFEVTIFVSKIIVVHHRSPLT